MALTGRSPAGFPALLDRSICLPYVRLAISFALRKIVLGECRNELGERNREEKVKRESEGTLFRGKCRRISYPRVTRGLRILRRVSGFDRSSPFLALLYQESRGSHSWAGLLTFCMTHMLLILACCYKCIERAP
jgi:hypothetical protein